MGEKSLLVLEEIEKLEEERIRKREERFLEGKLLKAKVQAQIQRDLKN